MENSEKLSKVGIDLLTDPEMKKVKEWSVRAACSVFCGYYEDEAGYEYEIRAGFSDYECDDCRASSKAYVSVCYDPEDLEPRYCPGYF